ncbi:unnamed protein product, partial [Meganyctiphanes norvegica]
MQSISENQNISQDISDNFLNKSGAGGGFGSKINVSSSYTSAAGGIENKLNASNNYISTWPDNENYAAVENHFNPIINGVSSSYLSSPWPTTVFTPAWGQVYYDTFDSVSNNNTLLEWPQRANDSSTWVIAWPGEVSNWWGLFALVVVVLTGVGNVLVILAISWDRRLQNMTNYFLLSLAVTDLMVATLVMPLAIVVLVLGEY